MSMATTKLDNVISIASGKGGVGKTWLSISLANALANSGKKVILVDGDLGLANVDIQLGLMPKSDLSSVLSGKAPLQQAISKFDTGGYDILPGRSGSGSLASLSPAKLDELKSIIHQLADKYDIVLLDLGAGIDQTVRQMAQISSVNVVVTTQEPTALTDAYAYIKMRHADDPKAKFMAVINQAVDRTEGEKTYHTLSKACENFLKFTPPLAGIIPHDTRVSECIRQQMPIFERYPTSDVVKQIGYIAKRITDR